jgi:histone H3/H4
MADPTSASYELSIHISRYVESAKQKINVLGSNSRTVEAYGVRLFDRSNIAAIHGKHVIIMPRDMQLVFKIREETP